ncbi:hypothetical protein FORC065_3209 [Yersinia enterocolitica]|nr:hypothetical protein FORC065_3209 [Yersinia enterocolitica]
MKAYFVMALFQPAGLQSLVIIFNCHALASMRSLFAGELMGCSGFFRSFR